MCHSEVIKYIKELENKKDQLLSLENRNSTFSYQEGGNKIVPPYSYKKTRSEVDALDEQIRKLRHALAVANCSVMVEEFGVTIGEALVMLAQYQNKRSVLETLSNRQQINSHSTFGGGAEITECNYDVRQAEKDYENLRILIGKLQVAIDRANLTNYVEV